MTGTLTPPAAAMTSSSRSPLTLKATRAGADRLAPHGDRVADGMHDVDEDLRLDRLAGQRLLDDALNLPRRAPGHLDAPRVGNGDRAVAPDDLFGNCRAVRPAGDPVGDRGRREQSARARFPNRHGYAVANSDQGSADDLWSLKSAAKLSRALRFKMPIIDSSKSTN